MYSIVLYSLWKKETFYFSSPNQSSVQWWLWTHSTDWHWPSHYFPIFSPIGFLSCKVKPSFVIYLTRKAWRFGVLCGKGGECWEEQGDSLSEPGTGTEDYNPVQANWKQGAWKAVFRSSQAVYHNVNREDDFSLSRPWKFPDVKEWMNVLFKDKAYSSTWLCLPLHPSHFVLIFSFHLCPGASNYLWCFLTKTLCSFLIAPICATCPAHFILQILITLIIFGTERRGQAFNTPD